MGLVTPPFLPAPAQGGVSPGGIGGSKRSRRFVRNDWPSNTFQRLGRGFQWLSLVKHPETYCVIREVGSQFAWKLFAGRPQAVDPDADYEWAPIATPNLVGFSQPAGGGEVSEAAEVTPSALFVDSELIGGPVPFNYGRVVGGYSFVTENLGLIEMPLVTGLRVEEAKLLWLYVKSVSLNAYPYEFDIAPFNDGDLETPIYGQRLHATIVDSTPEDLGIGVHEHAIFDPGIPNIFQLRGSPDGIDISTTVAASDGATISLSWKVVL